jgi:hypothetical protein
VVSAFKNQTRPVAWPLRNRWKNALVLLGQMNCMVTHVYREGNKVADLIANFGLTAPSYISWFNAPVFINDSLANNKLGLPNFRICFS